MLKGEKNIEMEIGRESIVWKGTLKPTTTMTIKRFASSGFDVSQVVDDDDDVDADVALVNGGWMGMDVDGWMGMGAHEIGKAL